MDITKWNKIQDGNNFILFWNPEKERIEIPRLIKMLKGFVKIWKKYPEKDLAVKP